MTQFRPHAVIFDMDGLLVDSEPVWGMAEQELLDVHGHQHDHAFISVSVGMRPREYIAAMREYYKLPEPAEELYAHVITRMIELMPQVKPQPGAAELIAYVREAGYAIAIASSSPVVIIDAVVESQGWNDIFTVRCSGDHVAHGKPAPDVYLLAAERLNTPPSACLALEDSANGARAAVAAGMVTYAVPDRSHTRPEAFADITPHVFGSLHEVLAALRSAGGT